MSKEAYIKNYHWTERNLRKFIPFMDKVNDTGVFPEQLAYVKTPDGFNVYMEKIPGKDLRELIEEGKHTDFLHSVYFAQSLVRMYQSIHSAGIHQEDGYEGNFMFDTNRREVRAVDISEVKFKDRDISSAIEDFSFTMGTLYLREAAMEFTNQEVAKILKNLKDGRFSQKLITEYSLHHIAVPLDEVAQDIQKVDPRLFAIVLRALEDPKAEVFDEILALPTEPQDVVDKWVANVAA